MMVKVNDEHLDFDGDIEIEVQIKLFEEIQTSNGDYSYSFDLAKTNHNLKQLGLPFPDTIKSIYNNVECEIIDNSGFKIHRGSLQVNRITDVISCTFFGGNTQWFNRLNAPMSDLQLRKYDVDLTVANIQASFETVSGTKGIVFPILDAGALITRSFHNTVVEDHTPCFYVKTLFKEIFGAQGIKLDGDLFKDSVFNSLVVASNGRSEDDVKNRSCYVKKTTAQNGVSSLTKITFQDETTFPYFDGSVGNFSASTFTADVKMIVDVTLVVVANGGDVPIIGPIALSAIYKNGVQIAGGMGTGGGAVTVFVKTSIALEAGDTIEGYFDVVSGPGNILVGSTIQVTPTFIYRVFGSSSVPRWTQLQFVSNILRIFNALPSFNSDSNTLTINLFKDIKSKEPIDISDDIEINEIDYTEFVSSYAKRNLFTYQEGSDEDLRQYNITNFISYGSGALMIDNDFIENESDVLESDFTSPITYLSGAFDMSMERINFVELEEIDDKSITSVTDSGSGVIRLNMSNADDLFTDECIVRIESTNPEYNGEYVVAAVTSTFISVRGISFTTNATGTATLLRHKFTTDDSVYLFINVPTIQVLNFSNNVSINIQDSPSTFVSVAYFNLLSNGRQINAKYKQSLSFGGVNNPLSYQLSILDTYWGIFSDILSDPVMPKVNGYFHQNKFKELKTFLRPVRIKTNETNNLYYLNRNRGYKDKHSPCYNELIKL
jgi:hypothetical protein